MFRRVLLVALLLSPLLASPVHAAGVYGEFAADSMSLAGTTFPNAAITTAGNSLSVARSATLTGSSPFGSVYGTSSGKTYLSVGLTISAAEPASTTLTFVAPTPAAGWSFALGDVDAESVTITATGEGGTPLTVSGWYVGSFNYQSGQTDQPTWAGDVLSGRGSDTSGAAAWFTPNTAVTSITFTQRRLVAGGPSYQLWLAADPATFPTTTTSSTSSTSSTNSTSSTSSTSSTTSTTSTVPDSTLEAPTITGEDITREGDTYVVELTKDNTGLPGSIDVVNATTSEPGELTFADNVISFTPSDEAEGRVTIDYLAKNGAGRFAGGRIRFELETTPLVDTALPSTGSDMPALVSLGTVLAASGVLILARRRVH